MLRRNWNLILTMLVLLAGGTVAQAQNRYGQSNGNGASSSNVASPTQILGIQPNPANVQPVPMSMAPTPSISTVSVPSGGMQGATPGLSSPDNSMVSPSPTMSERPSSSVQTPPDAASPSAGDGVLRLRLALHELILLQQAAHEAGGDLRISIDPVGITTEDLIVPLARDPELLVKREGDVIVVSTRSPDAVAMQMRSEVQKLEERRRALLQDINVLERLSNSKSPLPPSQPSQ